MHSVAICLTVMASLLLGAEAMARRQDMGNPPVPTGSVVVDTQPPIDVDMSTNDSTMMPVVDTTMPVKVCNKSIDRIQAIFAYTNAPEFRDLSENEQILIYEVLAAGEGCKMAEFINAETAERIFRLLGDLPLRFVYTFTDYLSVSLQNEGVVIPL